MNWTELVKTADLPTVRQALTTSEALQTGHLALLAFYARDTDVRLHLVELLGARPLAEANLAPAHLAALSGRPEDLTDSAPDEWTQTPWLDLMSGSPVQGWTPMRIAAALGHVEVVDALVARGAEVSDATEDREGPLELAIQYRRDAMVLHLLSHGARPRPRTVTSLAFRASDAVLDALVAAGMDLNDWPSGYGLPWAIGYSVAGVEQRTAFIRRLVARGLRLDSQVLYEILDALRDPGEAAEILEVALEIADFDVTVDVRLPHDTPPEPFAVLAMREFPLAVVERLVAAGAAVPELRVKSAWPDADAKRAWLEARQVVLPEPGLMDFLDMNDDLLTVDRIVALVAGQDGASVAGIRIGAPLQDLVDAGFEVEWGAVGRESESEDYDQLAQHRFHASSDDEPPNLITRVGYKVAFRSTERAQAVFDALSEVWGASLGKPRGRKNLAWAVPGAQLTMRQGVMARQDCDLTSVEVELRWAEGSVEPPPVAAPTPPPDVLAATIRDSLNDLSADIFDVGLTVLSVKVTERDALEVSLRVRFTPYHSDAPEEFQAFLSWEEDEITNAAGHLSEGFVQGLVEAVGLVVDGTR